MVIEFKPAAPAEKAKGIIATAPVKAGTVINPAELREAVAKLTEPKPLGTVTIPVSASVAKSNLFKQFEAEGIVTVRGRPSTGNAKKAVTIRLDQDVVKALKNREDWRSEVNALLRSHLGLL